jgi:hypothetical protein
VLTELTPSSVAVELPNTVVIGVGAEVYVKPAWALAPAKSSAAAVKIIFGTNCIFIIFPVTGAMRKPTPVRQFPSNRRIMASRAVLGNTNKLF